MTILKVRGRSRAPIDFSEGVKRVIEALAMNLPVASDQSLILRIRSGDEAAATELYQRYAARVLGFVETQTSTHLRSQVDTEDIVQSIFKSIFHGMDSRGYEAPPGGTLWQLIAVIALHKVRKNASRRSAAKRDSRRTQSLDAIDFEPGADSEPAEEMEFAIREAIDRLKPMERDVVTLRIQGYSIEEIAEQSNKSPRTIERRLQQARENLTDMLELNH